MDRLSDHPDSPSHPTPDVRKRPARSATHIYECVQPGANPRGPRPGVTATPEGSSTEREGAMWGAAIPERPSRTGRIVGLVAFSLAYFPSARLGLALVARPEGVATLWPASGVALAALLLGGRARWPHLLATISLTNTCANLRSLPKTASRDRGRGDGTGPGREDRGAPRGPDLGRVRGWEGINLLFYDTKGVRRDEGRGTRDEGRETRDEGRGTRDEGRGTKNERDKENK